VIADLPRIMVAIDIVPWDIKGKALGVPVYQLLGGKVRDKVDCYCHAGGATPEALLAEARVRVAEGWNCLRWSSGPVGNGIYEPHKAVDYAIKTFRLLRTKLSTDIELAFDAHTRTSVPGDRGLPQDVHQGPCPYREPGIVPPPAGADSGADRRR
jgi:galactonate dehydratase